MNSFTKVFTKAEFRGDGFSVAFGAGEIKVTYEEKELKVLNDGVVAKTPIRINGILSAEVVGQNSLENLEGKAGEFIMDGGASYDATLSSASPVSFSFEKLPQ